MQIGINLKEDVFEVAESEDIICNYPDGVEIGYLKINPERIPVVIGAKLAEEEIARNKRYINYYDVNDRGYMIITDDRNVITGENFILILGNAYVTKKQGATYTGLTADEIDDWIYDFEDNEMFSELFPENFPKTEGIMIPR